MIKEIWRGWQGHFIGLSRWHLNTLLIKGDKKIVVSTVGEYYPQSSPERMEEMGIDRYFETMVFESIYDEWDDADVSKELYDFFAGYQNEKEAQRGHYKVLKQVKEEWTKNPNLLEVK